MVVNIFGAYPEACITQVALKKSCGTNVPIRWKEVENLYLFGTEADKKRPRGSDRLHSGEYVDSFGKQVLVVDVEAERIQEYLNRCSQTLKRLAICFADPNSVNVGCMTNLQELTLNDVSRVDGTDKLFRLKELSIVHTPRTSLRNFKFPEKLLELRMSGKSITSLDGVTIPANLEGLHLNGTSISDLDNVQLPEGLKTLNLSNTAMDCLPESIRKMQKLETLDLSKMKLKELPCWLQDLGLPFTRDFLGSGIHLWETKVELVDMSIFDRSQEIIRKWFEGRKKEGTAADPPKVKVKAKVKDEPLREVKVVFLGDGEVGKTHIIARLLRDGKQISNFPNEPTPGVEIHDEIYDICGRKTRVHFWDFGGQEILHSMHRMFLTGRTLYVVVLSARKEVPDDQARYWLNNLRCFTKDSPVMLVLNKMDTNKSASVNERELRKLYPNLGEGIVKLSALTDKRKQFQENFIEQLKRRIGEMEILDYPFTSEWNCLKEKLRNMTANYIKGDTFRNYCKECKIDDEESVHRELLDWFSDLGISFCYKGSDNLEDYVVLRPKWITNAISIILFNKAETVKNGLVPHDTISQMLCSKKEAKNIRRPDDKAEYKPSEVNYALEVFRKFHLSFLVKDGMEFLPMLCDANEPKIVDDYERDEAVLQFRMNYDYLPDNVIHRLMVDRNAELDLDNVWRDGARLVNDCTNLSAVVRTTGNELRIMVSAKGTDLAPQLYLNALKNNLERIHEELGLKQPEKKIVYNVGNDIEEFDYDKLVSMQKKGRNQIYSQKLGEDIPIDEILKKTVFSVNPERAAFILDIAQFCERLQSNIIYADENEKSRNGYLRDLLRTKGYVVLDETQRGTSESRKQAGELDLEIHQNNRWTIFEALNIRSSSETHMKNWEKHLSKLLDNYNPNGTPFLFLVSYLECKKTTFAKHCKAYWKHIQEYSPEGFKVKPETARNILQGDQQQRFGCFLQVMSCDYDCGGNNMTVYHYFVRMGK